MSKAALNMGLREFAFEVASRQVTTVLLSPGAVDTDMQRDLRDQMAKMGKPITSSELTIEQLKPEQNGKFLARDGTEIPW
jgi:NAD(P)-dependent dehydrogenase (short-subunit alcohol dehydrogenase family)